MLTGTATGLTVPFYAQEVEWSDLGVYRETNNWPGFTHVLALDDDDSNAIIGSVALPGIGGNVDIPLDDITLIPGVTVTVNIHIALGIDATHWSVKLGTLDGAVGIGQVKVLEYYQDHRTMQIGVTLRPQI